MKGSFILLGWSCANDFTMSLTFSSDDSSLQQSRLIFIRANPLSLLLVIIERWLVLIRLAETPFTFTRCYWQSQSHSTCKLGNCNSLQCTRVQSIYQLVGDVSTAWLSVVASTSYPTLYSVDNITECGISSWYRSGASSVGRMPSLSTRTHLRGRR